MVDALKVNLLHKRPFENMAKRKGRDRYGVKVNLIFININHDVGYESSESIPISLSYILAFAEKHGSRGIILDDLQDRCAASSPVDM